MRFSLLTLRLAKISIAFQSRENYTYPSNTCMYSDISTQLSIDQTPFIIVMFLSLPIPLRRIQVLTQPFYISKDILVHPCFNLAQYLLLGTLLDEKMGRIQILDDESLIRSLGFV